MSDDKLNRLKKIEELVQDSLGNPLIATTKDFFLGKTNEYDFEVFVPTGEARYFPPISHVCSLYYEFKKLLPESQEYFERISLIFLQSFRSCWRDDLKECLEFSHKYKLNAEYLFEICCSLVYYIKHKECDEKDYDYIGKFYSQNKDFIEYYLNNQDLFEPKMLPIVAIAMSNFSCYDEEFTKIRVKLDYSLKPLVLIYQKKPHLVQYMIELIDDKKLAERKFALAIIKECYKDEYFTTLKEWSINEKNQKLKDEIEELVYLKSTNSSSDDKLEAQETQETYKSQDNKLISVLLKSEKSIKNIPVESFYKVKHISGEVGDISLIKAILIAQSKQKPLGENQTTIELLENVDKISLELFCMDLLIWYYDNNCDIKQKWIVYFCAFYGGVLIFDMLTEVMEYLHNKKRYALKEEISELFSYNKIPKFKLDEDDIVFDYGTRKFNLHLKSNYKIAVIDESGQVLELLPNVTKNDDKILVKYSQNKFNKIKDNIQKSLDSELRKLEKYMILNETIKLKDYNLKFIDNGVMQQFAINLIWGVYKKGKLIKSFRYVGAGSFITSNGEDYIIEDKSKLSPVYPTDLSDDELSKWVNQLDEYEITQPILQLKRDIMLPDIDLKTDQYVFDWNKVYYSQSLKQELELVGFYSGFMAVGWVFEQFTSYYNNGEIDVYFNFSGMDLLNSTPEDTCNIYNVLARKFGDPVNLCDIPERIVVELFKAVDRVRVKKN